MEKLQKESSAALLREAPSLHGISKMFNISCYRLGGSLAFLFMPSMTQARRNRLCRLRNTSTVSPLNKTSDHSAIESPMNFQAGSEHNPLA